MTLYLRNFLVLDLGLNNVLRHFFVLDLDLDNIEVFTLPHVFRTIPMQNGMESDGIRANLHRIRVSPHGLAWCQFGTGTYVTELGLRADWARTSPS